MTLGVEGLAGDDGDGRRLPLSLGEFDERVLHQASRDLLRREGSRQRKRRREGRSVKAHAFPLRDIKSPTGSSRPANVGRRGTDGR